MPGNFDDIIREVLGGALKPSTSEYDTLNTPNVDEETFNKLMRGKTVPPLKLAGDVVPFPWDKARTPVDQLPNAGEMRSFSPYMDNYDYRWHEILNPSPANDANLGKAILRG